MTHSYRTPESFRQALEQRLRERSTTGADFARRRQLLVFERFLARIGQVFGDRVMLKGGLVLEVRLERARTTKDVDLRLIGPPTETLRSLQAAGRLDMGDFLTFEVLADVDHPAIDNPGMRYEGQRYRATCRLAGRPYAQPFGVDVGFGDPVIGAPDLVVAQDVLAFAGVTPPTLRLYPVVTHIAEKLHAYTLPRHRTNSRVKDLPDLALLASTGTLSARELRQACEQTFSFRGTHPMPERLPDPPTGWEGPYAAMVRDSALAWPTLATVAEAARLFLDPVLQGAQIDEWIAAEWRWRATSGR